MYMCITYMTTSNWKRAPPQKKTEIQEARIEASRLAILRLRLSLSGFSITPSRISHGISEYLAGSIAKFPVQTDSQEQWTFCRYVLILICVGIDHVLISLLNMPFISASLWFVTSILLFHIFNPSQGRQSAGPNFPQEQRPKSFALEALMKIMVDLPILCWLLISVAPPLNNLRVLNKSPF